jgi:hypothetical protein
MKYPGQWSATFSTAKIKAGHSRSAMQLYIEVPWYMKVTLIIVSASQAFDGTE